MTAYTFVSTACKYVVSVVNILHCSFEKFATIQGPVHDDLMHSSPD